MSQPVVKTFFNFCKLLCCSLLVTLGASSCGSDSDQTTVFEVVVQNTSTAPFNNALAILSTGVFAVHTGSSPAYTVGEALPMNGFESFAEDADSTSLIDSLQFFDGISLLGIVSQISDGSNSFLVPGESYRFVISANSADQRLSAFFKYFESNDVVFATGTDGVALFDSAGNPLSGDISAAFSLLDAGTEVNEEPGVGGNQAPRQADVNTGAIENGVVRPVDDGFVYAPAGTFRVTLNVLDVVDTP